MIKKTFFTFLIFLSIHIYVREFLKPEVIIEQNPWQSNQHIAQNFLYSKDDYHNIIVGSSISYHFELKNTKYKSLNLAFTGESAHQGLELIVNRGKRTGVYPKNIFIEINTLDKYKGNTFNDVLYNPFFIDIREHLTSFRDAKQPLPWLATLTEKHILPYTIQHKYILMEDVIGPKIIEIHLKDIKNKRNEPPILPNERLRITHITDKDIEGIRKELKNSLTTLIEHNCSPIFYETPMGETIQYSQKLNAIRQIIEEEFPASQYPYIANPVDSNYQSHDGYHLTGADHPKYTAYLISKIDSINTTIK